jgi:transcriptional regulator with XRE-family HTH domain
MQNMVKDDDGTVPGMAEKVEARRLQLGLSPGEFAKRSGVTGAGLSPVRKGRRKRYQMKIIRGVAEALRWRMDWYERIVEGLDPVDSDPVAAVADALKGVAEEEWADVIARARRTRREEQAHRAGGS